LLLDIPWGFSWGFLGIFLGTFSGLGAKYRLKQAAMHRPRAIGGFKQF
jgi:hypothetical protein